MAIAQVGATTTASGYGGTTNIGNPTGTVSGDVVYIVVASTSASAPTVSGFTLIYSATAVGNIWIYRRVCNGTEGSSFPVVQPSGYASAICCTSWSGVDNTNPEDNIGPTGVNYSNSTSATPGSAQSFTYGSLPLAVLASNSNMGAITTATSGFTMTESSSNGILGVAVGTASGSFGGITSGPTFTWANSVAQRNVMILLRPAGQAQYVNPLSTLGSPPAPAPIYGRNAVSPTTGKWEGISGTTKLLRASTAMAVAPFVGSRTKYPSGVISSATLSGTSTAFTDLTSRTYHRIAINCYALRFVWTNSASTGTGTPGLVTLQAVIELPHGSYSSSPQGANGFIEITFDGQGSVTVPAYATVVSDPIPIDIAAGSDIWVRSYAVGGTIPWDNAWSAYGEMGYMNNGSSGLLTSTSMSSNESYDYGNAAVWRPAAIIGTPMGRVPVANVYGIGDSILEGINRLTGYSYFDQVLEGAGICYSKGCIVGEQAAQFSSYLIGGFYKGDSRTLFLDGATDVFVEYATNDIFSGASLALTQSRIISLWQIAANRGATVHGATVLPRNNSSDNWATYANQSVTGYEPVRTAYNTWMRAGAPVASVTNLTAVAVGTNGALVAGQPGHPLTHVWDVASYVEVNSSGAFTLNGGLWHLSASTTDGIHPGDSGHNMINNGLITAGFTSALTAVA